MGMTLVQARKRRQWDQKTLARESGIDQSVISRLETGHTKRPLYDTVKQLEDTLEIPRGTLVFGQATL